jgi:uncharacterized protein YecT (DUF1311 family)
MMAQNHKQKSDPCRDTSHMGQQELNVCAGKALQRVEQKLETLLKQLGISPDSPEQKAWEAYRDAQLAAIYPQDDISSYGSVYPMCLAILRKSLTEGRIRDLKALTVTEGDVCYGYRAMSRKNDQRPPAAIYGN